MNTISEYFEALERIKNGKPERVEPGIKITKDSVALEAGRKKGSIKKSRKSFSLLIKEIKNAANEQSKIKLNAKEKNKKQKNETEKFRLLYEEAVSREIMLIRENYHLKKELAKFKKKND